MKPIHAYRHALARAAIVFRGYAENHRAKIGTVFLKGTPKADDTLRKAEANDSHAKFMDEVLALPVVDEDHADMVTSLQKSGEAILEQMTPLMAATVHMAGAAQSEAGELFDAIKRWVFFGKTLDLENVCEELGDIEFYLEGLRQNLGITREETLVHNMNKLVKGDRPRYAGGVFSDAATIARADKQPEGYLHMDDSATEAVADEFFGKVEGDPYVLGDPARNPDGTPYVGVAGEPGASEGQA